MIGRVKIEGKQVPCAVSVGATGVNVELIVGVDEGGEQLSEKVEIILSKATALALLSELLSRVRYLEMLGE